MLAPKKTTLARALLFALFVLCFALPAAAQGRWDRDDHRGNDITFSELRTFDAYLDSHPQVARELNRNPELVNNPRYLATHPSLRQFMTTHRYAAHELHENPRRFMNGERRYERWEERNEYRNGWRR